MRVFVAWNIPLSKLAVFLTVTVIFKYIKIQIGGLGHKSSRAKNHLYKSSINRKTDMLYFKEEMMGLRL